MASLTDKVSSCVFLSQEDLGKWDLLNTKWKTLRLVPYPFLSHFSFYFRISGLMRNLFSCEVGV